MNILHTCKYNHQILPSSYQTIFKKYRLDLIAYQLYINTKLDGKKWTRIGKKEELIHTRWTWRNTYNPWKFLPYPYPIPTHLPSIYSLMVFLAYPWVSFTPANLTTKSFLLSYQTIFKKYRLDLISYQFYINKKLAGKTLNKNWE